MDYSPDRWAILRFKDGGETIYKVLGSWYGGYFGADSWRLNSGIEKAVELPEVIEFHGFSGSVYHCHKQEYGASSLAYGVYARWADLKKESGTSIEMLSGEEALSLSWCPHEKSDRG